MSETFDVIVIGAGPGGYVCAICAAQLGMKVACVEKRATLGGTCLNIGCIPSKALLQSSERYEAARLHFAEHGITIGAVGLDLPKMLARKDKVVDQTVKGVEYLFRKNKIAHVAGTGTLTGANAVRVTAADGAVMDLEATHIILATGSE